MMTQDSIIKLLWSISVGSESWKISCLLGMIKEAFIKEMIQSWTMKDRDFQRQWSAENIWVEVIRWAKIYICKNSIVCVWGTCKISGSQYEWKQEFGDKMGIIMFVLDCERLGMSSSGDWILTVLESGISTILFGRRTSDCVKERVFVRILLERWWIGQDCGG